MLNRQIRVITKNMAERQVCEVDLKEPPFMELPRLLQPLLREDSA